MNWTSLIIQIPVVALFAYVVIQIINIFMSSMHKRDEAYLASLSSITSQIIKLSESDIEHTLELQHHDAVTNDKLEDIKKRIGSRSRRFSA